MRLCWLLTGVRWVHAILRLLVPRKTALLLSARETAAAALIAAAIAVLHAMHLSRRITQGRADFIHLQLDDRAVGTVLRLIGTLLQTTLRDHTHAICEALRAMSGEVTPRGAAHE